MKKYAKVLWLPFVVSFITGVYACTHYQTTEKMVSEEAKNESPTMQRGELASRGIAIIQESKTLNDSQKEKLTNLATKMMQEMKGIREEESQLKTVLFKSIVDPQTEAKKIKIIKDKIIALDKKKTNKMLGALDEAQKIVGRKSLDDEGIYRAIFLQPHERIIE